MITIRAFIVFILICGNAASLFGQKNSSEYKYFAYDANWKNISNIDSATYFSRIKKVNDTCWELHYYNLFGPMISKELYKDEANKIAHGEWVFYKPDGYMDSMCNFRNNMAHGKWYFFNDTGRLYKEKEFRNGRLIAVRDIIKSDSIKKANEDTTKQVERVEKESEFRGGVNFWIRYLQQNLRYPERAIKNVTQGKVVVQFVVDTEGNIDDIDLHKSVEYTLDDEAQRLIIKSPKWTPAIQDGRKVKSFKLQPIIFRLE
jgi:periplasmic protein TonB